MSETFEMPEVPVVPVRPARPALAGRPETPALAEPRSPVLTVDGLRIETTGGADIVDDISFAVRPGEVLALVGESGCGKTSTALALLGHARPGTRLAAGAITLGGQEVLRLGPAALRRLRGARISYVPQDPTASLNPRHRVG